MSITFSPRPGAPTGFRVGCSCETNQGPVFGTYADAEEWYSTRQVPNAETLAGCEYAGQEGFCEVDIPFIKAVYAEEAPRLNVANGNAILLLEALGLLGEVRDTPFGPVAMDACGSLPADQFLGRVLAAEVMSVGDPGMPRETFKVEAGPTIVGWGRRVGYVDEKLTVLREIALWAQAHNVEVVWG
jgi:hypothetical protein